MRRTLLLALPLLLAACGEPASKYEGDDAAPPAPAPVMLPAPPPAPVLAWSAGDGAALVLREGGKEVLRLSCVQAEGLVVLAPGLKPVGSEERLSVGSGDVVATLVATPAAVSNPPSVRASGAADPALLEAIGKGGGKIAVNYGAQNAGPFDPPPSELAQAFVTACRETAD